MESTSQEKVVQQCPTKGSQTNDETLYNGVTDEERYACPLSEAFVQVCAKTAQPTKSRPEGCILRAKETRKKLTVAPFSSFVHARSGRMM